MLVGHVILIVGLLVWFGEGAAITAAGIVVAGWGYLIAEVE